MGISTSNDAYRSKNKAYVLENSTSNCCGPTPGTAMPRELQKFLPCVWRPPVTNLMRGQMTPSRKAFFLPYRQGQVFDGLTASWLQGGSRQIVRMRTSEQVRTMHWCI
jgi:hypothetical protein